MSLFNFFNNSSNSSEEKRSNYEVGSRRESFTVDNSSKKVPNVTVYRPHSFKDVEKIIDTLKNNEQVILHTGDLQNDTKTRVLDLLSGAIYALGGAVYQPEKDVYMFTPSTMKIR